jgi:hypothetical protein
MTLAIETLYQRACLGNPEAWRVCEAWNRVAHRADDYVDQAKTDAEEFTAIMAQLLDLTMLPFYRAHADCLHGVVLSVINTWTDSVKLERGDEEWQRRWADAARSCGNEVIITIARLCGGWAHARQISLELRADSWINQHQQPTEKVA